MQNEQIQHGPKADVLIVGSGASGTFAAVEPNKADFDVVVLD